MVPQPADVVAIGTSWEACYDSYRNRLRGRSIEDTISRLSIAERIFTAWHQTRGLAGGVTVQECFTDEGIEHLQDQLLACAEGRYESRAPFTVNSIVKTVMTFARYCCRKKWIERLPHVDSIEHDETMKGRPITGEEFERMLAAVPKVVGDGPAESWRLTLRVLWESTFRVGDVMDFSWDDIEHIHPIWPKRHGQHPTIAIPSSQKNGENQEIAMLPGLAVLLANVPKSERVGWVVNPERVECQLRSRHSNWFQPAPNVLADLIARYSNCAIAKGCGVSETTVRNWLRELELTRKAGINHYLGAGIPADEIADLKAGSIQRRTHRARRAEGRPTKDRVSRVISLIGNEANVLVCKSDKERGRREKFASAHDLRRGGAVRLMNAGVSAESLQVIMRHKDFDTTQKFYGATRAAQAAAAEVYQKLVPEDQAGELVGG